MITVFRVGVAFKNGAEVSVPHLSSYPILVGVVYLSESGVGVVFKGWHGLSYTGGCGLFIRAWSGCGV